MRTNVPLKEGQVWRSSDPRRLSAFRIVSLPHADIIAVLPIYPASRWVRWKTDADFAVTGPKGYTRVS